MDAEFPQPADLIYLNHAGVAPWPQRTMDAVSDFARENATCGPVNYDQWVGKEHTLRSQLCQLINAPSSDDIALLKNTSEALSVVASGIEWSAGDNVITARQEFPSNRIVWESLHDAGVETRLADLDGTQRPEDKLMALADGHTRLMAISSVQYASGLRIDLRTLGDFCRAHDIFFCVDAIQSLGAVAFDVQACNADFVAADGHKWMLGPEGVALFYCREEIRERLQLRQFGWHMVETVGNYDQLHWQPARSSRRFECGSPNMLGIHALSASLSLLLETGMDRVETQLLENSALLIDRIAAETDFELLSPIEPGRYAGIVNCRHTSGKAEDIVRQLREQQIYAAVRAGGIRLSPHFYTGRKKLEKAVDVMFDLARR